MIVNPSKKTLSYGIEDIAAVEQSLNEIERQVLTDDSVSPDAARSIVSDLNCIRYCLCIERGVQRHKKFVPRQEG